MDSEWTQNGLGMDSEWTRNGLQIDPEWADISSMRQKLEKLQQCANPLIN